MTGLARPVFFAPTATLERERVTLDGPDGRHAALVLRMRAGEELVLTDGRGSAARARVVELLGRTGLAADVVERWSDPRPSPRLVVVQALPKGERGETAVETMTEVGVDVIVPWQAHRCVTRWVDPDRAARGTERWRSTVVAAAKQSRRVWWPEVTDLATTEQVVARLRPAAASVVLHESAFEPLVALDVPTDGDVVLVVGPEGGLTDDEVAAFLGAGADVVRLGPTVLRTSTAGTVAAGVVLSRTRRWG